MRRFVILTVLAAAPPAGAAPSPKPATDAPATAEAIRKALDAEVTVDFAGVGLHAALKTLAADHKLTLAIDPNVQHLVGFGGVAGVPAFPGAGPRPSSWTGRRSSLKLKNVKLKTAFRKLLDPVGLVAVPVGEQILVATEEAGMVRVLKQKIDVSADGDALNKVLADIAKKYGVNVVIDPRAVKSKAASAEVTLSAEDMPLEAGVRLLCELADLKPVRVGSAIYVTTPDRADKLRDGDLTGGAGTGLAPAYPTVTYGGGPPPAAAVPAVDSPAAVPEKPVAKPER